jgi:hypothetical protein
MKTLVLMIVSALLNTAMANELSVEKIFTNRVVGFESDRAVEKAAIVELIKSEASLSSYYNQEMKEYYDFLDPSQIPTVSELTVDGISPWNVSSYFRFGQGDYELCDINTEEASYNYSTFIVGFNTSYKREETYGLWAVVSVNWDWCNDIETLDKTTKERLVVSFSKWIDSDQVSQLIFQ